MTSPGLAGYTAGRTTLNGEGLQHQDGHSHILAGTIPNCVSYDPTYGYELAVIPRWPQRMYEDNEKVFYYLTLMNENYVHGAMPAGPKKASAAACTCCAKACATSMQVQPLGSGTIPRKWRHRRAAARGRYRGGRVERTASTAS